MGQKRILAIDLTHEGFNEILHEGVLSNHDDKISNTNNEEWKTKIINSDVIIQWDPERDIYLNKLNYRTIQIGLRNKAVENYCRKFIYRITDITDTVSEIHSFIKAGRIDEAMKLLPKEVNYNHLSL